MKRLAIPSFLFLFLVASAEAQSPAKQQASATKQTPTTKQDSNSGIGISPGEVTATPEMWFYDQARRQYQDPKLVVRQKAEFRTSERLRRMAALRWFGFSNSRPMAGVDPIHGDYGPYWTSGNVYQPFRWAGGRSPTIVVTPASGSSRNQ